MNEQISLDEKLKSIEASIFKDEIKPFKDKLKIAQSLMKSFFEVSLEQIIQHVKKIVETIPNIRNILIVGGYGESSLLQESFKKEFPLSNIVIPNESSLAVIKGAVLFGHNPRAISARILRYFYGAAADDIFDPEIHPEEKRYVDENGIGRCKDAFGQLIAKDTKVPSKGKVVTEIELPLMPDQKSYDLRIYCTEKIDASVIDESFKYVGRLDISVPEYIEGEWEAEEHFVFGMAEINVSVTVRETGEKTESTFDLLE
ncbi:heat shock 70 kDa protein 12A-like [Saccostrea cucullata]|uniref:heat shock 70 kDa protein 12A-like n=1 Tax=Saccostrea cuccullata TaxID=36930 RepID=UPI002ED3F439